MSVLRGQNILLGISASIAAYKCGELVRQLVKNGANVRVIQTPASTEFITQGSWEYSFSQERPL